MITGTKTNDKNIFSARLIVTVFRRCQGWMPYPYYASLKNLDFDLLRTIAGLRLELHG